MKKESAIDNETNQTTLLLNRVLQPIMLKQRQKGLIDPEWLTATTRLITMNLIVDILANMQAKEPKVILRTIVKRAKSKHSNDELRIAIEAGIELGGPEFVKSLLDKVADL